MDKTELHYVTYDPEAIWKDMMLAYVEAGGDILYPGDEKEMLLRSVLADIVQVFAGVDNGLRMQTLRYAVGEYLDILGEQRSCERIRAAAARATIAIATNATGQGDALEAGTAMTADGEVFYYLLEGITITGYAQTITAEIIADRTGSIGNRLTAGTQMQLQFVHPAINSIIVATDAAGGQEAEDDDTYRERIRTYGLTSVSTGPQYQYERAAKTVSSEILDAHAIGASPGEVEIYLILASDTGASAIIQSVSEALSDRATRPLTDRVTIHRAIDAPYTLNVKYYADASSSTSAAIADAATEYQKWQDQSIGRAFNPEKLAAMLYQAGATRVLWGEGSQFREDGEIEYTEIEANERCKGTITLMAISG